MTVSPYSTKAGRRWYFVVDVTAGDGRRQVLRRGFATKKAAAEAERAFLHERDRGVPFVELDRITLGAFLVDVWLPSLDLRPTTMSSYRRIVTNHLVPRLGSVRLQRLDVTAVDRMLVGIVNDGLSPKTARNVAGVLSVALGYAEKRGFVARNATSGAQLPRLKPAPMRVWTDDQVATFLEHTAEHRLYPLWRLIAVTGCRRGEGLGLRWPDLDLDRGTVTFTNQRTSADGVIVEGPPKTRAGARTVRLDADTVSVLRAWRRRQLSELMIFGVRPEHHYVFTTEKGDGYWPETIGSYFWHLATAAGLPPVGLHGLRHSNATSLLAAGENPKVVSDRLGHAGVAITLSLYTHTLPAHDQQAADTVAKAFTPKKPKIRDQNVITDDL
jgi:integrase